MKRFFIGLVCLLVSVVFIAAGILKFAAPADLVSQMKAMQLPLIGLFPWLALFLPTLEIVLGLALWLPRWRAAAWLGIMPLTVVFTVILVWSWWRGLDVSCGCFGDVLHFSLQAAIVRNVLILVFGFWCLRELNVKKS